MTFTKCSLCSLWSVIYVPLSNWGETGTVKNLAVKSYVDPTLHWPWIVGKWDQRAFSRAARIQGKEIFWFQAGSGIFLGRIELVTGVICLHGNNDGKKTKLWRDMISMTSCLHNDGNYQGWCTFQYLRYHSLACKWTENLDIGVKGCVSIIGSLW